VTSQTPEAVATTGDGGDETARRYRYQWTFAAIVCCALLDETEDIVEVFCEHHEDVLAKHKDGSFSGLQVKTRASDQEVWKTNDEALLNSCGRFAKLEQQFPGQFKAFRFLTNHPLYVAGNGQDFAYCLEQLRQSPSLINIPGPVMKFLSRVAKVGSCSVETAFTALRRTSATDDLPRLPDIEMRLVTTLTAVWSRASDCSHGAVVHVARALFAECARASSLAHEDLLPAYLPATGHAVAVELVERLTAKRFNAARLIALLDEHLNDTAALHGELEHVQVPGVGTKNLLVAKLDAGGFSAVSCNSASDLRDKADYLGMVWIKKYGRSQGLQRYTHVKSLVLAESARAFEATKHQD
jgi:hypothetical protein